MYIEKEFYFCICYQQILNYTVLSKDTQIPTKPRRTDFNSIFYWREFKQIFDTLPVGLHISVPRLSYPNRMTLSRSGIGRRLIVTAINSVKACYNSVLLNEQCD
jgi:hypothetical protein